MLFITANFYLMAIICACVVFGQDLAILYWKVENQKNLIERVRIGIKMGYDKSETFFKNVFASSIHFGSEKVDLKKSVLSKENEGRYVDNNKIENHIEDVIKIKN